MLKTIVRLETNDSARVAIKTTATDVDAMRVIAKSLTN